MDACIKRLSWLYNVVIHRIRVVSSYPMTDFLLAVLADEGLVGQYDDIMKLKEADDDFIQSAYGNADQAFKRGGVGITLNQDVERANPVYDALNGRLLLVCH
jgi:hypothetical protein